MNTNSLYFKLVNSIKYEKTKTMFITSLYIYDLYILTTVLGDIGKNLNLSKEFFLLN